MPLFWSMRELLAMLQLDGNCCCCCCCCVSNLLDALRVEEEANSTSQPTQTAMAFEVEVLERNWLI
jgi:hypothetical protein